MLSYNRDNTIIHNQTDHIELCNFSRDMNLLAKFVWKFTSCEDISFFYQVHSYLRTILTQCLVFRCKT